MYGESHALGISNLTNENASFECNNWGRGFWALSSAFASESVKTASYGRIFGRNPSVEARKLPQAGLLIYTSSCRGQNAWSRAHSWKSRYSPHTSYTGDPASSTLSSFYYILLTILKRYSWLEYCHSRYVSGNYSREKVYITLAKSPSHSSHRAVATCSLLCTNLSIH